MWNSSLYWDEVLNLKLIGHREFPGGPVVRPFTAEGPGSIPGPGTKIPRGGKKNKRPTFVQHCGVQNALRCTAPLIPQFPSSFFLFFR